MLVALLLLANLGFFALARGWLQPYVGLSTQHEREPQRLAAQVNPESVRVRAVGAAASTPARQLYSGRAFQRRADRSHRVRSRAGAARSDSMAAAAGRDGW